MNTIRLKLIIAYDGANYSGWQIQKVGLGVQQVVEESIHRIFQQQIRVHGSSRTDTGVHARGMVAHFDLPSELFRISIAKLPLALNSQLPEDVRVMEAHQVSASFHARFDAVGKEYRYTLYNHHSMDPLLRRTVWHVPQPLDLAAMERASTFFIGKRDFAAFANTRTYEMESTVRTLHQCALKKNGRLVTFVLRGDGFLYKMCRGIVGTIVQVGQGRFAPEAIERMLEARDRRMSGMTAPAHGLVLWEVFYS